MATDTTTQNFLTTDAQDNTDEIDTGLLAEAQSGNAAVAQIGRWFSTQHTFLQGGLTIVAADVGGTATPSLTASQQQSVTMLSTLTGTAFDQAYLPADIIGHGSNLALHQSYIADDTNATVVQLAQAELPIIQDHLYELQSVDSAYYGGAAPTVTFDQTFTAAPPLATPTANNAGDQTFIDNAFNDATTGVDEGNLALTNANLTNTQVYGAWEIVNDGPLNADVASLASSTGATVPGAVDAQTTAQLSTLSGLTGQAFDSQLASYSIANYQAAIAMFNTEVATGSDAALVALATAATPTAEQLLAQAVIDYGESAGGLNDTTAAPTTLAGSILNAAADAAATGTATIAGADGTTTMPSALTGAVGIQFVNGSETAAQGYGFVIDTASAAATVTGAANQFEAVNGSTAGITYYGGASGSGEIALNGGTNEVLGATSAGAYYVGIAAGTNTIYAGDGNDSVSTSGGDNTIGLGSGNNVVASGGLDTIVGTTGADTIFATAGASQIFAGSKGITYVGGSGTLGTIYTGATAATVYGGSGSSVSLSGAASGSIVVAGAGNETLTGSSLTGGATFFAGSGNDVITGGSTPSSFVLGTGDATVSGSASTDLFQFVNGAAGGSDALAFTSSDVISLSGYASNAEADILSSQKSVGGTVSFTLSDNTHVTLTGVSSLTSANFV